MTESMWADALPAGAATAISTPTETLSPARLSTIRIRISGKKTLLEAYQSPLFMGYHDNQPWNDNMLRPCPISCVWGFGGVLLHLLTVNNRWNHPAWIFVKCTAAGAALLRMHERQQQKPAENHIEYILDRCFTDQTLQ